MCIYSSDAWHSLASAPCDLYADVHHAEAILHHSHRISRDSSLQLLLRGAVK